MTKKTFLGVVGPQVTLYGQAARPQPPMGLAYVLGAAKRAGWEPVLFDSLAEGYGSFQEYKDTGIRVTGLEPEQVIDRINRMKPDAIGVALGLSTDHDYVKRLVERIKQSYDCPILLGGSEASLMHDEIMTGLPVEQVPADFVVTGRDIGSGEESVYRLLKAIEGKTGYEKVPGIAFMKDGTLITTDPVMVTEKSLSNIRLPRRDLFKTIDGMDIYSAINRSHTGPVDYTPYSVMHTSRGCGGACTFCHIQYNGFDRTLIRRSLDNISLELQDLKARGVQTISIEDDNFGGFSPWQTGLAVRILEEIRTMGFAGVYFPNGMTVRSMINKDHAILKQLKRMADKGIKVRTSLPAESGDEHTLKAIIRKPHALEEAMLVAKEMKDGGYLSHENISIDAFLMVGVVGYNNQKESWESVYKTFNLADLLSDWGLDVNVWWMKPNPNGPQYKLWRHHYPNAPFYKLHFSSTSGIWGTEEEEERLDKMIRRKNAEMNVKGRGSKRPIYPVDL